MGCRTIGTMDKGPGHAADRLAAGESGALLFGFLRKGSLFGVSSPSVDVLNKLR